MPKDRYTCQLCQNHGLFDVPKKGHKQNCPYRTCSCNRCYLNTKRRELDQRERNLRKEPEAEDGETPASENSVKNENSCLSAALPLYRGDEEENGTGKQGINSGPVKTPSDHPPPVLPVSAYSESNSLLSPAQNPSFSSSGLVIPGSSRPHWRHEQFRQPHRSDRFPNRSAPYQIPRHLTAAALSHQFFGNPHMSSMVSSYSQFPDAQMLRKDWPRGAYVGSAADRRPTRLEHPSLLKSKMSFPGISSIIKGYPECPTAQVTHEKTVISPDNNNSICEIKSSNTHSNDDQDKPPIPDANELQIVTDPTITKSSSNNSPNNSSVASNSNCSPRNRNDSPKNSGSPSSIPEIAGLASPSIFHSAELLAKPGH